MSRTTVVSHEIPIPWPADGFTLQMAESARPFGVTEIAALGRLFLSSTVDASDDSICTRRFVVLSTGESADVAQDTIKHVGSLRDLHFFELMR